ncbi:MAG: cation:proton antiporter [Flavobacteriales bacterium Tduv]
MDYSTVISLFCILIIASYLFDMVSRRTKFPSVILLILSGMGMKILAESFNYEIPEPFMKEILPSLGNIGLILIVLEGALELEITAEKRKLILRSFLAALVILLLTSVGISYTLQAFDNTASFLTCLRYAIPFGVISSAVAIPSVASLEGVKKEFLIYESTFSDILGIILFNFILKNDKIQVQAIGELSLDIFIIFVASILVTYLLLQLMNKITHYVKFFLILSLLILTYLIGKYYHLSSLIIIFFFGLFLKNTHIFIPNKLKRFVPLEKAKEDLHQFFLLTAESAFLIRTFFFLFFGFSIDFERLQHLDAYIYGGTIVLIIYLIRFVYLGLTQRKNLLPEALVAPRGLISILLFLQFYDYLNAKKQLHLLIIKENTLLIVILGSMLIMMLGIVKFGGKKSTSSPPPPMD